MTRPLRINILDGVYHVTSRGLERRSIAADDDDRRIWGELLGRVAIRRDWAVFAWALMSNHFHLFVRTPRGDLSAGMHDLNSGYVSKYNRRHGRSGPLLQGRFKAILVERNHHYLELSRYIHLNPVRAGLVHEPWAYPWSSCTQYLGMQMPAPWLAWREVLAVHGGPLARARKAYADFLRAGIADPPASPCDQACAATLLGSDSFLDGMRGHLRERPTDPEVPLLRQLQQGDGLEPASVDRVVAEVFGVDIGSLHKRSRNNRPRQVAMLMCRTHTTVRLAGLGVHYGGISAQAVHNSVAAVERVRGTDPPLDTLIAECDRRVRKLRAL